MPCVWHDPFGSLGLGLEALGTEPKMKIYFFGKRKVGANEDLAKAKKELAAELERLWEWTKKDAVQRSKG